MTIWNERSAVEATGGRATEAWFALGVEIDSRKVKPGDLFVAIKGERFDGHAFVADALSKGAVAAVVNKTDGMPEGASLLIVDDSFKALEDLARHARARSNAKVVGVTGSVGKTSAKEMLKIALSAHGKTFASSGNFNNHIGTPLNLANLPPDADFAVFEMGMNHAGEISHLTQMVRPDVAVITNVESVHLEFFASQEGIADAKAEIFDGVVHGGIAVLNGDNQHLNRLKIAAAKRNISDVATFGESINDNVRLIAYEPIPGGCNIAASVYGNLLQFKLGAIGRHWAKTALMTLTVSHELGLDDAKTAQAIAAFSEPEGRGKLSSIAVKGGTVTLIDDSYNASPASMKSAFTKTSEVWDSLGKKGRKIAVLGDMLELGGDAASFHSALATELKGQGFDLVFSAGSLMKNMQDSLPEAMRGAHVSSAQLLLPLILKELMANDVLLIKGSHGSKIYELAGALLQAGEKKHAV